MTDSLQLGESLPDSSEGMPVLLHARPRSKLLRVRAGRFALPGLLHTDAAAPIPSLPVKLLSQEAALLRLALLLALLLPPPLRELTGTGAAMSSACACTSSGGGTTCLPATAAPAVAAP